MRKLWTLRNVGIGLAAVVLAVAVGTAAFAMRGGDDASGARQAAEEAADDANGGSAAPMSDGSANGAAGASLAMCIQGAEDCVDTVVDPDAEACAADGCDMLDRRQMADCPPDMACIEPWLMDPVVCPEDIDPAECRKLECEPYGVDEVTGYCQGGGGCFYPMPMPVEILPAPAEDLPLEGPRDDVLVDPIPEEMGPPVQTDPGEPIIIEPLPVEECPPPPEPCGDEPAANVRCLPPDCTVSSDGGWSCYDPCTDPDALVLCVPPECTTDVDGGVSCPGSPGECVPGPAVDCGVIEPDVIEGSGGGTDAAPPSEE